MWQILGRFEENKNVLGEKKKKKQKPKKCYIAKLQRVGETGWQQIFHDWISGLRLKSKKGKRAV